MRSRMSSGTHGTSQRLVGATALFVEEREQGGLPTGGVTQLGQHALAGFAGALSGSSSAIAANRASTPWGRSDAISSRYSGSHLSTASNVSVVRASWTPARRGSSG